VSCNTTSIDEFDKIMPVSPPILNNRMNPIDHIVDVVISVVIPCIVAIHLKILMPVGTAIIIVADVKYARVSTSIPTVNMWCAHTTNPKIPIDIIA